MGGTADSQAIGHAKRAVEQQEQLARLSWSLLTYLCLFLQCQACMHDIKNDYTKSFRFSCTFTSQTPALTLDQEGGKQHES